MPSIKQPSPSDDPGAVIDEFAAKACSKMRFRHRHADGIREALPERAGCCLNAGGEEVLRVAGGFRTELAEVFDLLERHVFVAGEIAADA
jgi:hypothetical protein